MSKALRNKQKRFYGFNKTQQLIQKLDRIQKKITGEDKRHALELGLAYMRKGYFLKNERIDAEILVSKYQKEAKARVIEKSHYLYAIGDDENLKIGMSVNPSQRLKSLQTSSPRPLSIKWQKYCAEDSKEAFRQEKKLQRRLKRYHISGEWYSIKCLDIVLGWRIKNRDSKDQEEGEKINNNLDNEFSQILG